MSVMSGRWSWCYKRLLYEQRSCCYYSLFLVSVVEGNYWRRLLPTVLLTNPDWGCSQPMMYHYYGKNYHCRHDFCDHSFVVAVFYCSDVRVRVCVCCWKKEGRGKPPRLSGAVTTIATTIFLEPAHFCFFLLSNPHKTVYLQYTSYRVWNVHLTGILFPYGSIIIIETDVNMCT